MPDPFFASNKTRKRKRTTSADTPSKKFARKGSAPTKGKKESTLSISKRRDEELSDETNDEDGASGVDDMDLRAPDIDPNAYESSEEDEDETPAEKRLRLAKLYLESVKQGLSLGISYLHSFIHPRNRNLLTGFPCILHSRRRIRCCRN